MTGPRDPLAQYVDFEVGMAKRFLRPRRPTAEQRSHSCQQLGKGERLYQIVVRAQFEAPYALVHGIASRQEKHKGALTLLAQASENLPTIQTREHHIENDEIERQLLSEVQPIPSVAGDVDNKTRFS